jgi:hypothetical protein
MAFEYPLRRNTVPSRVRAHGQTIRQERRKPVLPGPYIYVSGGTGSVAPNATWQSPEWQNDFTSAGTNYFGFRHGLEGATEFTGQLDLTAGAVTRTVAFTLPLPFRVFPDPRVFPIDLDGAGAWTLGVLWMVQSGTGYGDVVVDWPIQATAI